MQDDGQGIAEEKIPTLFKMFGSENMNAEDKSDGIGLGLHISKKLVDLNDGNIIAFSNGNNRGTVIEFTMRMKATNKKLISTGGSSARR